MDLTFRCSNQVGLGPLHQAHATGLCAGIDKPLGGPGDVAAKLGVSVFSGHTSAQKKARGRGPGLKPATDPRSNEGTAATTGKEERHGSAGRSVGAADKFVVQLFQRLEPRVGDLVAHKLGDPAMRNAGLGSDLRPIATPALEFPADFGVKVNAHALIIAKLCATGKQPIAKPFVQSVAMPARSLNQLLGLNLARVMAAKGWSANALGKKAGIAPNTIGNYLRAGADTLVSPASGKERSAKLTEVECLARALDINPLVLLTDPDAAAAEYQRVTAAVAAAMGVTGSSAPAVASIRKAQRRDAA